MLVLNVMLSSRPPSMPGVQGSAFVIPHLKGLTSSEMVEGLQISGFLWLYPCTFNYRRHPTLGVDAYESILLSDVRIISLTAPTNLFRVKRVAIEC